MFIYLVIFSENQIVDLRQDTLASSNLLNINWVNKHLLFVTGREKIKIHLRHCVASLNEIAEIEE